MHPSVVIGIIALVALYIAACIGWKRQPRSAEVAAFVAAVVTLIITLGPVDALAERHMFTAHMVEHALMTLVFPPLLLLGVPDWMLRPWVLSRPVRPFARFFTNPIVAFLTFTLIFVTAHTPTVFDLMCRDEPVHICIHLAFMVSGTLLWWPIISTMPELPRLSYPMQVLYIFLLMIPMTAVAAPITLSSSVVYNWYLGVQHPWGLTPMNDQTLGGLTMWIVQPTYLLCIYTAIFVRWMRHEDTDQPGMNAGQPVLRLRHIALPRDKAA